MAAEYCARCGTQLRDEIRTYLLEFHPSLIPGRCPACGLDRPTLPLRSFRRTRVGSLIADAGATALVILMIPLGIAFVLVAVVWETLPSIKRGRDAR